METGTTPPKDLHVGDVADDGPTIDLAVECPTCRVRYDLPARVRIMFPGDADAIVDLLEGRLNVHECQVCERPLSVPAPLFALHTETGAIAIAAAGEDLVRELRALHEEHGHDAELSVHATYGELHRTVRAWTDDYMMRATGPLFADEEPALDADGIPLLATSLALLVMHEQAEGRLPTRLVSEPPLSEAEQREIVSEVHLARMYDLLGDLYREAFHGEGLSAYPALVERRIPARCFTTPLLERVMRECRGWENDLITRFDELSVRLRAEYVNAVAHVTAGRPNPRGRDWAAFAMMLFVLDSRDGVEIPANVRLSSEALSRTITFEDAWDVAGPSIYKRESTELALAWFRRLGMQDRASEHLATAPLRVDLSGLADMPDAELAERYLRDMPEEGESRTHAVAGVVRIFLREGRLGAAVAALENELDRRTAEQDWDSLAWMTIRGVECLREVGEHELATELLTHRTATLGKVPIGTAEQVGVLNEMGNAARYAGHRDRALEAYELAMSIAADDPDFPESDIFVAKRNAAIVLREVRRFSEAGPILDELELETRGERSARRAGLLTTLALNYIQAGLPAEALPYTREAAGLPLSVTEASTRASVLMAHGSALAGAPGTAPVTEFDEALAITTGMPGLQETVAMAALDAGRTGRVPDETLAHAEAVLDQSLRDRDRDLDANGVTAASVLAEHRLYRGDHAGAGAAVGRLLDWGLTIHNLPWQCTHVIGRLAEPGSDEEYVAMRETLDDLLHDVPDASGLKFSTPWIGRTAQVQEEIAQALHRAVGGGTAAPIELLDLADLLYARDIPSATDLPGAEPAARLAALAENLPQQTDVRLVAFLEHDDDIAALCVDPRHPEEARLERLTTARSAVATLAPRFERAIGPACVSDRQARRAEEMAADLLEDVGGLLEAVSDDTDHLCVVPSASLVGLPLHAAAVDGEPLLLRNPIALAPSPRMLQRAIAGAASRGPIDTAILTVPKDGESDTVTTLLHGTADLLGGLLGDALVVDLRGIDGSKDACLGEFKPGRQVIFLGHGADGASLYGRGLCVSDGRALPRGPLPVDLVPQLRRYVIDAADLESAADAPAIVTSLACSSGRARTGPGGTRIGLERSLFANGTRTIVAPLWDVAVESAVEFVLTLHESWRDHPDLTMAQHHRRAALVAREARPLLYHWAPFALNGSPL